MILDRPRLARCFKNGLFSSAVLNGPHKTHVNVKQDEEDWDLHLPNTFAFYSISRWHWHTHLLLKRSPIHLHVEVADQHPEFVRLLLKVTAVEDTL